MKFLTTFRLQIPREWIESVISMLINILNDNELIIQSACLLTLEKILFMKDMQSNESLVKDAVNQELIFNGLISSLVKIASLSINIFAMRCIYRVISLTSENYYKRIIESLSNSLNEILKLVIANSTEDQFNYYLFETIALVLRKLSTFDIELCLYFQNSIQEKLLYILSNSVSDLMGYVFQILPLELAYAPADENGLPADPVFMNIIEGIIYQETNWTLQMKYLFQPFISFIKSAFLKNKAFFLNNKQTIDKIFSNVIEKLFSYKNYTLAFELLNYLINFFDFNLLFEYIKNLLFKMFGLYNNLRENNKRAFRDLSKLLVVFFSQILIKTNSKNLANLMESIATGLTDSMLRELSEVIIDLDSQKNKKLVTYAYCSIITDFCADFDRETLKFITYKLVQLLEKFNKLNLSSLTKVEDEDLSYASNNFNKLINAEIKVK